MTTHKDYDSASFEADLSKVEDLFDNLRACLDNIQFREHIDATAQNFSGVGHIVTAHEEIMFELIEVKEAFLALAEDIRNAE